MVNYYDEQQDNGSSVPLVAGAVVGGAGAGYLANKHFSDAKHGLDSKDLNPKTNLGKIQAGQNAIKEAEAVGAEAFNKAQDRLTVNSWEHDFEKLPDDVKKAVSIKGDGEAFGATKAMEHVKDFKGAKANPVQFETAIHKLEEISRLSADELEAHPDAETYKEVLGKVSSDGKVINPELAETHLHQDTELLQTFAGDVAADAGHAEFQAAKVARATAAHPAVAEHASLLKDFEGKSAKDIKSTMPTAKPKGWKEMSSEVKAVHSGNHVVHNAALGVAEAREAAEKAIATVEKEGTVLTDTLKESMFKKHGVAAAEAQLQHAAASHPNVSGLFHDVAAESKGMGSTIKNIASRGSGKGKVIAAAVAGAAVVGGVANKMFGGPAPSTRVDPAQMQMMGQQQQAAMSY